MADFQTVTALTDAGPFVVKAILHMPQPVAAGAANENSFSVYVCRRHRKTGEVIRHAKKMFSAEALTDTADGLSVGYRNITAVYPCDADGEKVPSSSLLALEMSYGPLEPLSSYSAGAGGGYNDFVNMEIRITQIAMIPGASGCVGLVFDHCVGDLRPDLQGWEFCDEITDKSPLRYGYFTPEGYDQEPKGLLLWLHGFGGGGTDPRFPLQGNRVTGFSQKEAQKKLNNMWILVPQCPTMWMDDGKGSPMMYNNDTIYTEAVKATLDAFIEEHQGHIDVDKIVVAGNSNGGFMSVIQAMTYPDFYAAAVPVCEAVMTDRMTEDEIMRLGQVPIWFVHAKNDYVVDPYKSVVPLYERLKKTGAKEVHFTFFDSIKDAKGLFRNADGTPYSYIGHFAWVPVYNDDCRADYNGMPVQVNGCAVSLFEWIGLQHK